MRIRHALGLAAAVAMPLTMVGPAQAAADPYQQCKSGGFVNFKDPATGKPFANQGRCVSTLARDGALIPITPTPDLTVVDLGQSGFRTWGLGVTGSNLTAGERYRFDLTMENGRVNNVPTEFTADADGTVTVNFGTNCNDPYDLITRIDLVNLAGEVLDTVDNPTVCDPLPAPGEFRVIGYTADTDPTSWYGEFQATGLEPNSFYRIRGISDGGIDRHFPSINYVNVYEGGVLRNELSFQGGEAEACQTWTFYLQDQNGTTVLTSEPFRHPKCP